MQTALTIAGSDSSCGAGIQADIKTFHAHGVFGLSAITAVTVQNTQKVYGVQEIMPGIIYDQITCLFDDINIHAVKIGMVSSLSSIDAVSRALKKVNLPPVVLDPVMISTSGYQLMDPDAQRAICKKLFPLAYVVTPNIIEAELLTSSKIKDIDEMKSAAREIASHGAQNVVIKGGHLDECYATDVCYDGNSMKEIKSPRINTRNTHGTGCTFSSAIAANLAKGKNFFQAAKNAKVYITKAIEHSISIGKGFGPTNHFFPGLSDLD